MSSQAFDRLSVAPSDSASNVPGPMVEAGVRWGGLPGVEVAAPTAPCAEGLTEKAYGEAYAGYCACYKQYLDVLVAFRVGAESEASMSSVSVPSVTQARKSRSRAARKKRLLESRGSAIGADTRVGAVVGCTERRGVEVRSVAPAASGAFSYAMLACPSGLSALIRACGEDFTPRRFLSVSMACVDAVKLDAACVRDWAGPDDRMVVSDTGGVLLRDVLRTCGLVYPSGAGRGTVAGHVGFGARQGPGAEAVGHDSGYCYLRLVRPEAHQEVAKLLGSCPTMEAVSLLSKDVLVASQDMARLKFSKVASGLCHVDDHGEFGVATVMAGIQNRGCSSGIVKRDKVGAIVRCGCLGVGHLAAKACGLCTKTDPVQHRCSEGCVSPACAGKSILRSLAVLDGMTVILVRGKETLGVQYQRESSCVPVVRSRCIDMVAPISMLLLPPGCRFRFPHLGVSGATSDKGLCLMAVSSLSVVLEGDSFVALSRTGNYEDKIRWLHKYVGEDPSDTFSRFWVRSDSSVVCSAARMLPVPQFEERRVFQNPEVLKGAYEGEVYGVVVSVARAEGVYAVASEGSTVRAGVHPLVVVVGDSLQQKVQLGLSVGSAVTFARRLESYEVRSDDKTKEKMEAEISDGVDAYALDDGGPSDDEEGECGFVDEF